METLERLGLQKFIRKNAPRLVNSNSNEPERSNNVLLVTTLLFIVQGLLRQTEEAESHEHILWRV
jgi:hypothetical protein